MAKNKETEPKVEPTQNPITVVKTVPSNVISNVFFKQNPTTYCCGKQLKDIPFYEFVQVKEQTCIVAVCYDCLVKNGYKRIQKRQYCWERG